MAVGGILMVGVDGDLRSTDHTMVGGLGFGWGASLYWGYPGWELEHCGFGWGGGYYPGWGMGWFLRSVSGVIPYLHTDLIVKEVTAARGQVAAIMHLDINPEILII